MTVKSLNFRGHTQPALSQSLPSRNREPRATVMGSSDSKPEEPPEVLQPASAEAGGQDCGPKLGKSGKKICCSCPDTKVVSRRSHCSCVQQSVQQSVQQARSGLQARTVAGCVQRGRWTVVLRVLLTVDITGCAIGVV